MNVSKAFRATALAAAMVGAAPAASAYSVSPMVYDLKPSGSEAATTIRVNNDADKPITIEVVAEKREFDEKGVERREPADDAFVLFPPQAVVGANKTQAIRVQYVGPADVDKSVMYTVTVKQVPVELPNTGPSGVQIVFNFGTLANIVPAGAETAVQVVSVEPTATGYELRLRNTGRKYANLALGRLVLKQGATAATLGGEDWRKSLTTGWLLPGADRVIAIPAPKGIAGGGVTGKFEPNVEPELKS